MLSREEGHEAEKRAFLASEWPKIAAEAANDLVVVRTQPRYRPRSIPSLAISYYRRYLQGDRDFKLAQYADEIAWLTARDEAEREAAANGTLVPGQPVPGFEIDPYRKALLTETAKTLEWK